MSEQSTNTGKMGPWTAGLLALAAVVSFGLATQLEFWRGDTQSEATVEVAAERVDKLNQLEEGMAKEVNSYRWIKKPEGIVQLPIDVAMKATLKELQALEPRPSGVPVNPATMAPPVAPASPGNEAPAPSDTGGEAAPADAPQDAAAPSGEEAPAKKTASEEAQA